MVFSSVRFFTKFGHFGELIRVLKKSHEINIVSIGEMGGGVNGSKYTKMNLWRFTAYRQICYLLFPLIAIKISQFCLKNNIDVIVGFNGGYPQLVAHLASIICRKPFVVYVRVNHKEIRRIGRANFLLSTIWDSTITFSLRYAKRVIALSCYLFKSALSWGIDKKKVALIPFGVDAEVFRPLEANQIYPNPIVFVGRWSKEKGTDLLITLAERLPQVDFILVGASRSKLNSILKNLHPVGFVPHVDVPKFIAMGKAVISTSKTEGQPMGCLEALACGKPVLANKKGGLAEMITPEVGWLFDGDDIDSTVDVIENALASPDLLRKGQCAREYAMAYSWESHRVKFDCLLSQTLKCEKS